jgi:hypothetical protein
MIPRAGSLGGRVPQLVVGWVERGGGLSFWLSAAQAKRPNSRRIKKNRGKRWYLGTLTPNSRLHYQKIDTSNYTTNSPVLSILASSWPAYYRRKGGYVGIWGHVVVKPRASKVLIKAETFN